MLAWLLLRRTERNVWVRRNVSALQVEAGETAQVEVEIGNAGRRTGTLLLEEELSPALGPPPRFVVEPMAAGASTVRHYQLHTENRGRYPVGPMHVRVGDPLGMVDLDKVLPSTASVLVTPRTEPLPRIALKGRWAGAGDNRTRDLLGGGSPDVTIREYRLGDDLRRIHWPTSARAGELMVRREEQQWQSRCTLLIDNRRISHRGYGAALLDGARRQRDGVDHAQPGGPGLRGAAGQRHREVVLARLAPGRPGAINLPEQLERLALLGMTRHEQLSTDWIEDTDHGGMLARGAGTPARRRSRAAGRDGGRRRLGVRRGAGHGDVGAIGPPGGARDRGVAQRWLEGHHAGPRRLAGHRLDGAVPMTAQAAAPLPTTAAPDGSGPVATRPAPARVQRRLDRDVRLERDDHRAR